MPFYEYECTSCRFYTEVMQKISDAPLRKCPSCGRSTLKKLVSAPIFRLKGAGWYETDFKSEKEEKRNLVTADTEAAKADSKRDAAEAKPAEAKAPEGKPAAEAGADGAPKPAATAPRAVRKSAAAARKSPSRAVRPKTRSRTARKARR